MCHGSRSFYVDRPNKNNRNCTNYMLKMFSLTAVRVGPMVFLNATCRKSACREQKRRFITRRSVKLPPWIPRDRYNFTSGFDNSWFRVYYYIMVVILYGRLSDRLGNFRNYGRKRCAFQTRSPRTLCETAKAKTDGRAVSGRHDRYIAVA